MGFAASSGVNADARGSSAVFIDPQQVAMVLAMLSLLVAIHQGASPFWNATTGCQVDFASPDEFGTVLALFKR